MSWEWQGRAEKAMRQFCQGQLWNMDPYPRHDITTTALIGPEIGVGIAAVTLREVTCIEYARNLITLRPATFKLTAGRSPVRRWDGQHEIRSATPRPASWELTCLEHYVPTLLGVQDASSESGGPKSWQEFMLSDYTFMPSWDTSSPAPPGDWWDLMTTCIIAAKMMDDHPLMPKSEQVELPSSYSEDKDAARLWLYGGRLAPGGWRSQRSSVLKGERDTTSNQPHPGARRTSAPTMARHETWEQRDARYLEEIRKLVDDAIKLSKASEKDKIKSFEWFKRKPPRIYHAESVVQSLEDTPHPSKLVRQKNPGVRQNIKKQLGTKELDWSVVSIRDKIQPTELLHVSAFDLALKTDSMDLPEISAPIPRGRARWLLNSLDTMKTCQ